MRVRRSWMLALGALLTLAGCATPGQPRYHTLTVAPAVPGGAAASATANRIAVYRVAIGPASVPDALDRPQIVLSLQPSRHEFSDAENWSAPLKREIPRVLAEVVGQRLPAAHVKAYSQYGGQDADFGVLIDVLRFESRPGDSITLEAAWTLRSSDGTRLREGRSVKVEKVGAAGVAPLVAAHEKALAALGREIAGVVAGVVAALAEVKR